MVAIKPQNAVAFLAKPDPGLRAILLYGSDAGSVSERAQKLAAQFAALANPPGEIIRIDEPELDNDPDRLSVELLTVPMFGGSKIVRTSASRKVTSASLKPLLEGGALAGVLIVEAGNLRPDEGLRGLFEKSPHAAAVGCYADEGATLAGLIGEVLGAAKLNITPEARQELTARLGADRGVSRSELEKLALFAAGSGTVDIDHIDAIVGDASELAVDRVLNAAGLGDATTALAECDRAVASGESPQLLILMAQRHFQRLQKARAGLDTGRSLDELIRQMRPPLHFKQRAIFERQCRLWSTAALGNALARITSTAKAARLSSSLEAPLAERLFLEIARMARQAQAASTERRAPLR